MHLLRLAICVLVLATTRANVTAGELPREIATQYASAVSRMQQFYSKATIEGHLSRDYPQSRKSLQQDFVFRADGSKVRLDVTTTNQHDMNAQVGRHHMYMVTPYGSLDTVQNKNSPTFDDATEDRYQANRSKMQEMCPLTLPYAYDTQTTLADFLQSPRVKITRTDKVERDGKVLIRISYTQTTGSDDEPGQASGWLLLSPNEGWGLREYSRTSGRGKNQLTASGRLTYSGLQDGVPLVDTIECFEQRGPKATLERRETVAVSNFQHGKVATYYFTADAF